MSNQIGDRYTCSDPNCGCEIEVKSPCNMFDGRSASSTHVDEATNPASARPTRTATSEVGPVVQSSGTSSNRVANSSLDPADDLSGSDDMELDLTDAVDALDDSTRSRSISMSLTCFCGNQMTQSGSRNTAARAASVG
jgi:hypothetical protein